MFELYRPDPTDLIYFIIFFFFFRSFRKIGEIFRIPIYRVLMPFLGNTHFFGINFTRFLQNEFPVPHRQQLVGVPLCNTWRRNYS